MKRSKPYWKMNTEELANATREFDNPNYDPPALTPSTTQQKRLRHWQAKRAAARARLTLSLDQTLIEQTDDYAANHGLTFADVVTSALQQLLHKKSA